METSNTRPPSDSAIYAAPDGIVPPPMTGTGSRTDGSECSVSTPNANNVVHQRRRVNPESLAVRLGPDLVRDLDALITPGNTEMPSFAVRKELQERYDIDRRHIYDYFHSRGLRVVKEDKHGNPITTKDLANPMPNLRPLRQAPMKTSRSHTSYPVAAERKLYKTRGITKAKPGRPKKNLSVNPANPKVVPMTCETNESANAPVSERCPAADAVPTPTYVAVNPLDRPFSVGHATGDVVQHKSVFERTQEVTEYPAEPAFTDDPSLSWSETSPCSASDKGLLLPHAKPLTLDERQAIYNSISDGLGPAHGIQECQGTYRKYMQARTKLYFEGLLSLPHHHSQQLARTNMLSDRKAPLGTNEFRHWLSETRFLKRDGTNDLPRVHSNHRNANMAKRDGITDKQYRQISIPHWIQTLDDLFPAPGDNSDKTTTDSPVTQTHVIQMIAQLQGDADKCYAGAAETLQIDQAQLHGLSGFPGTQKAKTRMSFAELNRHSQTQWLQHAHVPYAAYSGQQPVLSDAQRRARRQSNNPLCLAARSPCKSQICDLDRMWTRQVTSHDARRRTSSAAGGI